MSELRRQLIANASKGGTLVPFVDVKGFHLHSPSHLGEGEFMEWFMAETTHTHTGTFSNVRTIYNRGLITMSGISNTTGSWMMTNPGRWGDGIVLHPLPNHKYFYDYRDAVVDSSGATESGVRYNVSKLGSMYWNCVKDRDYTGKSIRVIVLDLTIMNMEYVSTPVQVANEFGYDSQADIPYFSPDMNATLVNKGGKLYYAR